MKTSKKDHISESSDNSDENSESSKKNGNSLNKSKNSNLSTLVPESDSTSKCSVNDTTSVNKNSINGLTSQELPRTISAKAKEKTIGQEISTSVKSTFNFEDLTSDDEIYTFQCPEMYKKHDLLDRHIDFTKSKQLTTETQNFELEVISSEKKFITLALPRNSSCGGLVKLPLKGHIIITQIIDGPVQNSMIEDVEEDSNVVFPQDIKIRHPLLGVDWEAHIQVAKEAIKRRNCMKRKKKKDENSFKFGRELKEIKMESCEVESSFHKKKKRKLNVEIS